MELLPSGRISDGCELHPGLIFKDKEKKRRKGGEKEEKRKREKSRKRNKKRGNKGGKEYSTEGCLGMETGFQYLVWDA
ncbi:hypothetical protein MmTuc01_2995 [Methanosarcina mazei Tuc01]|uniref:Uncharacterized protein n=1 Tax=Methanosarcina mazei Tuc01 TaxID=1236903 RepID=M1QMJ5_METMZ|nr:hypothetical protein [Methanosarcina mazei]AGF98264.1 hypothetical protein MmTuc01_2995 [Methanosarcina mazei Tuc01]